MTTAKKKKESNTISSKLLKLENCYLFAIASPADLAARLGASVAEIEELANANPYKFWTTAAGREIQEPKRPLQRLHGRVHELLARVEPPPYLHSSVRGTSYITNAKAHISPHPAVKLDIKKFFPSVTRHALFQFFYHRMKCARDAAGLLARLLTCDGRLATGSRASPILAYYAFKEMFDELYEAALARDLNLTCYVDDITITGVGSSQFLPKARKIVTAYGLRSHKVKLFSSKQPRIITGVVVTKDGIKLPNRRHQKIRQEYDRLKHEKSTLKKLELLGPLISRVYEAAQIDPNAWTGKARDLEQQRRELRAKAQLLTGSGIKPQAKN